MAQNIVHETGYYSTGRISANYGARVTNPTQGPPFVPQHYPIQAQDPLAAQRSGNLAGPRGRVYGISQGAPVQNPVTRTGPPFYPARQAVRAHYLRPSPVAGTVRGSGANGAIAA